MTQKCEYASINEFGRLICTVDNSKDSQLCIFQRYCTKACEWQNSRAFSTCERRKDMAKNKNKAIKIENEQVENVRAKAYIKTELDDFKIEDNVEEDIIREDIIIEPIEAEKVEAVIAKKEVKRFGKVISVSKFSIVVQDENGKGYTLYNHPDAKYGDVIEF